MEEQQQAQDVQPSPGKKFNFFSSFFKGVAVVLKYGAFIMIILDTLNFFKSKCEEKGLYKPEENATNN